MDDTNTHSDTHGTTHTPDDTHAANADTASSRPGNDGAASGGEGGTPFLARLIQRARDGAHEAVDTVADSLSAKADGVQGGVSKVTDTKDEWVGAARDVIREHPFATIAGALLVGAAVVALRSGRER